MNQNQLVSLDDAALDEVNGGASISLGLGDTQVVGASLSLADGLKASLSLFGKKILDFSFSLFN